MEVKDSTALRLDASGVCQRLAKEPASVGSFTCSFVPADDLLKEEIGKLVEVYGGEGRILGRCAPDVVLVWKRLPLSPQVL